LELGEKGMEWNQSNPLLGQVGEKDAGLRATIFSGSPLLFFPWPGSEVVTPIFGFLVLSHLSRVLERADYLWCPYFYDFPVRFNLSERKPQRRAGGSGKAAEVYITQTIVTQSSLGRFTMSFVCYVQRPVDFLRYFISWARCIFLLLLACLLLLFLAGG
jgi:hypothetical protein